MREFFSSPYGIFTGTCLTALAALVAAMAVYALTMGA